MEENQDKEQHEFDLPLSSNFHDVKVEHYILDLTCYMKANIFHGVLTIFCKRRINQSQIQSEIKGGICKNVESSYEQENEIKSFNFSCIDTEFGTEEIQFRNKSCNKEVMIILDCCAIDVKNCYTYDFTPESLDGLFKHCCTTSIADLRISECCMKNYYSLNQSLQRKKAVNLDYIVSDCKITMLLPTFVHDCCEIIIRIDYETQSLRSPSLMWTFDQMQRPCVFTVGHQLNNRSLFPSQDMPQAMSTWHCNVTLTDDDYKNLTVLTTGESMPVKLNAKDQVPVVYHSYNSFPMPAATFALAIGEWSSTDLSAMLNTNIKEYENFLVPSCHLFSPACLHLKFLDQFVHYLPSCFQALHSLLGPYPLNYLSILIAPSCFDSLGMACPHLLILSQSILCSNLTMLSRLAHELCHTWFGILSGPQDWTEEWLTEGVCCYLEDILHGKAMKWDQTEYQDHRNLRALLKYRLLTSEISNSTEYLQILRPQVLSEMSEQSNETQFVKNGLDPEKTLIQVHYLKGFFLLYHLEQKAGEEKFLMAIKTFINGKLGHLYSSKDFLHFIFNFCPSLSKAGLTVDQVCKDWLDSPGMPQELVVVPPELTNKLVVQQVYHEISSFKNRRTKKGISVNKSKHSRILPPLQLLKEQQVLFLDILVEGKVTLTPRELKHIRDTFHIPEANAEVQHSWCELVISQLATRWTCDIQSFLINHQAMGVYLYGELIITENQLFQQLAYDCFTIVKQYMPEGTLNNVTSMLFPS